MDSKTVPLPKFRIGECVLWKLYGEEDGKMISAGMGMIVSASFNENHAYGDHRWYQMKDKSNVLEDNIVGRLDELVGGGKYL